MDAPIRTEALSKTFKGQRGEVHAVDGMNLSIEPGEFFGLLGPNGAGKSTTIGMLTTRVVPTAGRAFISGIDVVRHAARVKSLIGVVQQTNTLDRALTVSENLEFHGRFFGMSAATRRDEARSCSSGSPWPTARDRWSSSCPAGWPSG